jgi:very-short-patch-repair endonuclease
MQDRQRARLPTTTLDHARSLRRSMTDAEHALWSVLRAARFDGIKFRRQHPIPPYIADFCCLAAALVIELDGSQHDEPTDRTRTAFIEGQGFRVLRFWDHDALLHTEAVADAIWNAVATPPLSPTPLPAGEGLSEPRCDD